MPMADINQGYRIGSIDVARGAVMVLMALDHVRVYSGVPAGGATAGIFLTRWITNFCAPVFVFLAGSSIFLHGQRLPDRTSLSRWLVIRGTWLVVLELTYLRLAWTFNLDFAHYMLAGVIWMLGWCMILMAVLVHLPPIANAAIGLAIMAGHNIAALAIGSSREFLLRGHLGWLCRVLYFGGGITTVKGEQPNFWILYSIIPWIGVMAAGYAFGEIFSLHPTRRRRMCFAIGASAIAAFLVLQSWSLYRDPTSLANAQIPIWITFLTATKYPASFIFLLMTLGPTLVALPVLEGASGRLSNWLAVFGRVPLFYYLLHIPLIHAVALAISLIRSPAATSWLLGNHPVNPGQPPVGYTWSLGLLYSVTVVVVVTLYLPCRWFAQLKARGKDTLLSYL